MALFCVTAVVWNLVSAVLMGGVGAEVYLFSVLSLIFGALWWSGREKGSA